MAKDAKATSIRRGARRTCPKQAKTDSAKWGPEIARVVSLEQAKAEAVIEALEAEAKWAKKRKVELEINWKASEGQSLSDVIRGQWLAYDEMLEKYLQPKLDRLRRAAK